MGEAGQIALALAMKGSEPLNSPYRGVHICINRPRRTAKIVCMPPWQLSCRPLLRTGEAVLLQLRPGPPPPSTTGGLHTSTVWEFSCRQQGPETSVKQCLLSYDPCELTTPESAGAVQRKRQPKYQTIVGVLEEAQRTPCPCAPSLELGTCVCVTTS